MKANELMIGDWVLDKKTNRPYKIIGTNDLLFHDDYSHIPLTAEILEKNGFNETFWGGEWTNNKVDFILIEHNDGFRVTNTNIVLSGVHQLQHALRLCNIDKEVEL